MTGASPYTRLEVMKMERGVSYLDVIYTAAPFIGLVVAVIALLGNGDATADGRR